MRMLLLAGIAAAALGLTMQAQEAPRMTHASGTFDVTIKPQPADAYSDATMGRMTVDKVYHGDLEGTAVAQMLTGMSASEKESGVYVAVERVTGTLHGRKGTFLLYHQGVMDRGKQNLKVAIGPDSGTGELVGITGTLNIDIRDGKHFYTLDYTLGAK